MWAFGSVSKDCIDDRYKSVSMDFGKILTIVPGRQRTEQREEKTLTSAYLGCFPALCPSWNYGFLEKEVRGLIFF